MDLQATPGVRNTMFWGTTPLLRDIPGLCLTGDTAGAAGLLSFCCGVPSSARMLSRRASTPATAWDRNEPHRFGAAIVRWWGGWDIWQVSDAMWPSKTKVRCASVSVVTYNPLMRWAMRNCAACVCVAVAQGAAQQESPVQPRSFRGSSCGGVYVGKNSQEAVPLGCISPVAVVEIVPR
jgi:hypothetical protein